ncbi:MAG: hypothetical protein HY773_02620 [Candidatus Terrybacteria bacterium]|nr:hypothetical protein [Candidatus Terrybacteria bacterium]
MATSMSILALGAESAGNFSVFKNGKIYLSKDYGDLLNDKNFQKFKTDILNYLKKNKIKPKIILTDLHPFYKTTDWGKELAKKFKVKHIQIQHHLAHIFSVYGEKTMIENCKLKIENFIGIACDGTGYGLDGKIWGGEIFKIKMQKSKCKIIERIGHLENQTMLGGELAIREPARMVISILSKLLPKEKVYPFIKKFYTKNEFEILHNQLKQNFNCQETSSTGRILDAVSVLLGFAKNQRKYKHEPIDSLEKNSTLPYRDIKPKVTGYELLTTPLFEYLIKNLSKDKKRLAATSQIYIAQGLYKIIKKSPITYFAGGIANNKIISAYLQSKGIFVSQKVPRGDAGISFGQIVYYISTNSRD